MKETNYGSDNTQILKNFRDVCRSYRELFKNTKDHIVKLLGQNYHYHSGIFRESILKNFLEQILPKDISIDTGFIYGFDELENSKQIDILLWDQSKYSPVYRTKDFVIVPPESVAAVIEVKSNLKKDDINAGLDNLLSIVRLDVEFREKWVNNEDNKPVNPPIGKFLVSYVGGNNSNTVLQNISSFYQAIFATDEYLCNRLVPALIELDPFNYPIEQNDKVERIFPKMILSLEDEEKGYYRGYGPPEDIHAEKNFNYGMRRIPYFYAQRQNITTPFEKFIGHILYCVYRKIQTEGWSTMFAWSDFNPMAGFRFGDVDELVKESGIKLIDHNQMKYEPS